MNESNWLEFISEWGTQFNDVKYLLNYMHAYDPQIFISKPDLVIAKPEEMDHIQKEWLLQCNRYDHPIEKSFFKPCWLPVTGSSYDFFIDLSNPDYPLFEIHFFQLNEGVWFKTYYTYKLADLLNEFPLNELSEQKYIDNRDYEFTAKFDWIMEEIEKSTGSHR